MNIIESLVRDFKAQNLSTYMDALVDGVMIRVALWDDGIQSFIPTQAGRDLVIPPPEPVAEQKPKNIDVRQGKLALPDR